MKNKTIHKTIMTIVFIVLLPFLIIEALVKSSIDIFSRIRLSYQLMLFVINLSNQK